MADVEDYRKWFASPPARVRSDLESYAALLLKWNKAQNLVSRETEKSLWQRHVVDSLQLLPVIDFDLGSPWNFLDIGSGGGLPAIPLAIAYREADIEVKLVEPIAKKATFLRTAIRELQLPAVVFEGRVEQIDSRETPVGFYDVITSRALAALTTLFPLIHRFFGPQTVAILHKGKDHAVELAESRLAWDFDVVLTNSVTDDRGVLLRITNLRPKTGV